MFAALQRQATSVADDYLNAARVFVVALARGRQAASFMDNLERVEATLDGWLAQVDASLEAPREVCKVSVTQPYLIIEAQACIWTVVQESRCVWQPSSSPCRPRVLVTSDGLCKGLGQIDPEGSGQVAPVDGPQAAAHIDANAAASADLEPAAKGSALAHGPAGGDPEHLCPRVIGNEAVACQPRIIRGHPRIEQGTIDCMQLEGSRQRGRQPKAIK